MAYLPDNMNVTKQGEKLLLLVRRDVRMTEEIAIAMGIDKSYLPKLYKMEVLPAKPFKKALEVFQVPAAYFLETDKDSVVVAEPHREYPDAENALLTSLQTENATLRDELRRLTNMLEEERAIKANLAEALKNLSKRD